jgi:hypothetical protein
VPDPTSSADRLLLLRRLTQKCVEDLGAAAASVVLGTGGGSWVPTMATSEKADALEQYSLTVGEGPCFDALNSYAPVIVPDLASLDARSRWPIWTAAAAEAGFGSVVTFPIQAGAIVAGALTAYGAVARVLSPEQFRAGLRLADAALLGLIDVGIGLAQPEDAVDVVDELSALLRGEVHRAAGMVMAQANVSIDEALVRLRAAAFSSGRSLLDIAADVLERRLRFEPDADGSE